MKNEFYPEVRQQCCFPRLLSAQRAFGQRFLRRAHAPCDRAGSGDRPSETQAAPAILPSPIYSDLGFHDDDDDVLGSLLGTGPLGPAPRARILGVKIPAESEGLLPFERKAIIGNVGQLVASCGNVPAVWFTTSKNYEQVVEAMAQGQEPGRGWGDWNVCYPGILVRLIFDGDIHSVRALMWGHTVNY